MNETKAKEFNPLAVNILRLQNYNPEYFDLCEIVFFEWLMVKASSFKNQYEFYYSVRRIAEETKIKKAQLATIINKFEELGIITVEKKGMPKCSYFHVNKETVIALIPQIYQFTENGKLLTENGKLLSYFGKLLTDFSKHKGTYKELNKEPKKETSENEKEGSIIVDESTITPLSSFLNQKTKEAAEKKAQREAEQQAKAKEIQVSRLKDLLNRVYAERVEIYNSEKKKGERVKRVVNLPFLKRNEEALYELGNQYDDKQIQYSFTAYIDYYLTDQSEITKPVSYFLSRKPKTKDFDTFATYLSKFIEDYSSVKA